jgi:hypothetical protein
MMRAMPRWAPAAVLLLLLLAACGPKPLQTLDPIPVPAGLSAERAGDAAKAALAEQGWAVTSTDVSGAIYAIRTKDNAPAESAGWRCNIIVSFDANGIYVSYVESAGLDYQDRGSGQRYIDGRYNEWMAALSRSITANLAKPPS